MLLNKFKNIWQKSKDKPFTFFSVIIGALFLLFIQWISFYIYSLTGNIWANSFAFLFVVLVTLFIYLFVIQSRQSTIAFLLCSIVIVIVNGYQLTEFKKYRYGRKIDNCTIEKSLTEKGFVLAKFINTAILGEHLLYQVTNHEENDDRDGNTSTLRGTSYFKILIPFIDKSFSPSDSIYYYYLIEDDMPLHDEISDQYFVRKIEQANRNKHRYLTVEENEDLSLFIKENKKSVLVSDNVKLVTPLESEEYLLTGGIEKYNSTIYYIRAIVFWLLVYGALKWFGKD